MIVSIKKGNIGSEGGRRACLVFCSGSFQKVQLRCTAESHVGNPLLVLSLSVVSVVGALDYGFGRAIVLLLKLSGGGNDQS